ncbi:MAG: cytochrome c biogenesis protein CcdA [Ilumatobacteraceae bacterium]
MNAVLLPLAAVAAGIVSATSPCVLPVIPGYLAAVSLPGSPTSDRGPSVRGAFGFVAGFTAVFTILGATASALGDLLYSQLQLALNVAGVLLIVAGMHTVGLLNITGIARERRVVQPETVAGGPRRALLLGMVFALGWTPCIGPILATILTKAAADASLAQGMGLLVLYSAGLGIPFIAVALWFERSAPIRRWLSRHSRRIQRIGGIAMIAIGIAYTTGFWEAMFTGIQRWLARSGWPPL